MLNLLQSVLHMHISALINFVTASLIKRQLSHLNNISINDSLALPHSTRSMVCVTVGRPSVCLSVPSFSRRCCRFTAERPAGKRYRSIAARRSAANAGSATVTADAGSWTQTRYNSIDETSWWLWVYQFQITHMPDRLLKILWKQWQKQKKHWDRRRLHSWTDKRVSGDDLRCKASFTSHELNWTGAREL